MHASWIARQPPPAIETLDRLEASGLTRELASLLAARGVSTPAEAAAFLDPGIDSLHDPLLLKGMKEALDLLLAAHSRGERVAVIGDYDVDGVTATAQQAEQLGCRLVVTADYGIRAYEALAEARRRGLPVIVTDHHLPGEQRLDAAAVVNPRQAGCSYPFRELAGVGLAMMLGAALLERFERPVPRHSSARTACWRVAVSRHSRRRPRSGCRRCSPKPRSAGRSRRMTSAFGSVHA